MISQKKIALIHIIKKDLGLNDADYREMLHNAAGVRSSKDLTDEGFRLLMHLFVRSPHYRDRPDGITLKQKLYIQHLVKELTWDENHFKNWLLKYHHCKELTWIKRAQASHIIDSLKKVSEHRPS